MARRGWINNLVISNNQRASFGDSVFAAKSVTIIRLSS